MKYYAICALLLVPLVYGAALPRTENADNVDLVPDMSVANDADSTAQSGKRHVPPFHFMSEQMQMHNPDIDQLPDMSVAADAEQNEAPKVEAAVADMSVAADGEDQVSAVASDMSAASEGKDKVAALVPDMSVASDAE
ncbi:uncharacterized protein LOC111603327 isoform X2 [Drosophila hydei]|uniref:Uncharacterized protein LOC111603327 isoform X2 n=1 Tax=Drosophila hydei TaxID=7224 RepID=A0A6J1M8Q7_DROHY|nr:uncharacterized protein LOC111603327 isoform X2 [Drosophila hydei]